MSPQRLAAMGVLVAAVVLFGLTQREGHCWSGDYAAYLFHARNLLEGRPYGEIGYLYNPGYPQLGPRVYPPVFPALLAAAQWSGVQTLEGLKLLNLLVLGLGLGVCVVLFEPWLRRERIPLWLFALMLPLAHVTWALKDFLYSDLLFFTLFWSTLLFYQRRLARGASIAWGDIMGAGLLAYAALGMMAVGAHRVPRAVVAASFPALVAPRRTHVLRPRSARRLRFGLPGPGTSLSRKKDDDGCVSPASAGIGGT